MSSGSGSGNLTDEPGELKFRLVIKRDPPPGADIIVLQKRI